MEIAQILDDPYQLLQIGDEIEVCYDVSNRPEGQGSTGYARGGMRIRPKGVEQSSNRSECAGFARGYLQF